MHRTTTANPKLITETPLPTNYWTEPNIWRKPILVSYCVKLAWHGLSRLWYRSNMAAITRQAKHQGLKPVMSCGPTQLIWVESLEATHLRTHRYLIFEGSAYNARFTNPIIIDGYLYYTLPVSFTGASTGATVCQDLRTGKIVWSSTTQIPALSFGYVYQPRDPDQHGIYPPILFTANFAQAFDAYTGDPLFNVTGIPTGTAVPGPQGEQLKLILTNNGNATNPVIYLSEWNSSRLWGTWQNPWTNGVITTPTLIQRLNNHWRQLKHNSIACMQALLNQQ